MDVHAASNTIECAVVSSVSSPSMRISRSSPRALRMVSLRAL
jgi:hypothetical protein